MSFVRTRKIIVTTKKKKMARVENLLQQALRRASF